MARQADAVQDVVRDVVVVGGGAAGLSAALTLARARRSITVVDAGAPRNAPADGVHGLLALDGINPADLLARARWEVLEYGGELLSGEVAHVSPSAHGFAVELRDGSILQARRLLIATGLIDELPEISGVREQWGRGVLHCAYCHGWEVRDRRIGILATGPMSVHQALMFHQWSRRVQFFTNDVELELADRAKLDALSIPVLDGQILQVVIEGDRVSGVRVKREGGDAVTEVDIVVVSTKMVARTAPFAEIGIVATPHPAGAFIESDAFGRSAVPGVWVAGNASDLSAQVSAAAADGARAGQHVNADLVMEDVDRAVAQATNLRHHADPAVAADLGDRTAR